MKCHMDRLGTIHIEPETELEIFALVHWCKVAIIRTNGSLNIDGNNIMVHTSLPEPTKGPWPAIGDHQ